MTNPIQIAIQVFDAQCVRCAASDEELFLLELKRLVDLVDGNSQLQRCISEIVNEAEKWIKDFHDKDAIALNELVAIRNDLIAVVPEIETEEGKGDIPEFNPTIRHFDKLLSGDRKPGITLESDQAHDESLRRTLFNTICRIAERHLGGRESHPPKYRDTIVHIEEKLNWLNNEIQNFSRSHPGCVWFRISSAVSKINPPPEPLGTPFDWDELMREAILGVPFRKVLYGWRSRYGNVAPNKEERERYCNWKNQITDGLDLLKNEISVRLSTRTSSYWAIRKYIARTSIYRYREFRHELDQRKKIRSAKGRKANSEEFLVDDAASYLFDMGFGVLTERHLGSGRLDIYEETLGVEVARDALLIEAKIYTSASLARKALETGLAQLYGYATSIESSFHPTENYLLMYRLSGPKMVFPRELVQIGEYSFRIVHIDLAPPDESGSRSPKPVVINTTKIAEIVLRRQQG